jgi:hypothetical protein
LSTPLADALRGYQPTLRRGDQAFDADLGTALDSFGQRRFERCRMVVDNGLQIQRWEVEGSPDADPAGLTMRTQMAISGSA